MTFSLVIFLSVVATLTLAALCCVRVRRDPPEREWPTPSADWDIPHEWYREDGWKP